MHRWTGVHDYRIAQNIFTPHSHTHIDNKTPALSDPMAHRVIVDDKQNTLYKKQIPPHKKPLGVLQNAL